MSVSSFLHKLNLWMLRLFADSVGVVATAVISYPGLLFLQVVIASITWVLLLDNVASLALS